MGVHPTGKSIEHVPRAKAVHYGLNSDNQALREDRYRRCIQCGMMCHLDRDLRVKDGGVTEDGISHEAIAGSTPDNPVVNSGCPLCGSHRWAK